MNCAICKKNFSSLGGLHNHLNKTHGCSQDNYYHTFFPRYDLHDKELIVYKNHKQYHESDFNSRENFSEWLAADPKSEKVIQYCIEKLRERAIRKESNLVPSQVEAKSIMLPSILGWQKMIGDLDLLECHGLKLKYDYNLVPVIGNEKIKIYRDTREQRPLPIEAEITKLSVGDYTAAPPHFKQIFIERKDLSDICGTLSVGWERFEKEILRAREFGFYLVVLVECLYSDALHYSANTKFNQKMNGGHLMRQLRLVGEKYHDTIQFLFSGSRKRSCDLLEKILKMGEQVRNLDLEYLKDRGVI